MKHYGDITKINGAEAPVVDIITGGSPCQDLSVAGKRAGLAGERSGLFMEQMRIVKEMRERERATGRTGWMVRPRYMVWENVPGAFSSGNPKGADFAAVIEEIIKVAEPGASVSVCVPNGGWTKSGCYYAEDGSWSIAWRVHDAQFWGVPQRRKRIALVADFGGLSAPEILFERKGLSGDSEQSRAQREATAGAAGEGVEGAGGEVAATITATYGTKWNGNAGAYNGQNFVIEGAGQSRDSVFCLQGNGIDRADTAGCNGRGWCEDVSYTLNTIDRPTVMAFAQNQVGEVRVSSMSGTLNTNSNATGRNSPLVYDARGNGNCYKGCGERQGVEREVVCSWDGTQIAPTLTANNAGGSQRMPDKDNFNAVLQYAPDTAHALHGKANCQFREDSETYVAAVDCRNGTENPNINGTLQAKSTGGTGTNFNNVLRANAIVRRLTPLECERLQGYPDGWTDIGEWVDSNGKKHGEADSPRYKALGNSIALPFWQWMARRICAQYERPVTMASLFDGIGGFPLVFQRCGAVPVWASEIEEFPIAVTKVRFPDESM